MCVDEDDGCCEAACRSAGVLPVAYDAERDAWMALLGCEAHRAHFRAGGTWCDFGGVIARLGKRAKPPVATATATATATAAATVTAPGGETPLGCAARELVEETLGVVAGSVTDAQALICRNTVQVLVSNEGISVPYCMYVVRVAYDKLLPWKFRQRAMLNNAALQRLVDPAATKLHKHFREKSVLQWVPVAQLARGDTGTGGADARYHPGMVLRREFRAALCANADRLLDALSKQACAVVV